MRVEDEYLQKVKVSMEKKVEPWEEQTNRDQNLEEATRTESE